jgi:catechol 2,3-dioxygenase-like lactoylglutathione lyase family enzyme
MIQGLRTVIYKVPDLEKAKAWYTRVLGFEPYFAEPFYVGFRVGGFELGLDPDMTDVEPGGGGVVPYWGVADATASYARLLALGASAGSPPQEVGGGIRVATVRDPFGNVIGIIENPHFSTANVR